MEDLNETLTVDDDHEDDKGSSVTAAVFNFTNCIVGAGAIGLGGAMAQSGGMISLVTIVFFAILTKLSLDLVIRLTLEHSGEGERSYEDLGQIAFGRTGRLVVVASKFLYSSGCLVAYTIVVKDNFGPAVLSLLYGSETSLATPKGLHWPHSFPDFLHQDFWVTWTLSSLVILPLCMLRDMRLLASVSVVSVVSMISIVLIVIYLFVMNPNHEIRHEGVSLYSDWLEVRWGYMRCLGTFVFAFVSQHTVHLAFASLKPSLQTLRHWKRVSSYSLVISCAVSMAVGGFVYASFWQATKSDIFEIYPAIPVINIAKLLLCITMLLTFPLPFFTCRELLIITFFPASVEPSDDIEEHISSLEEPLLNEEEEEENDIVSFARSLIRGDNASVDALSRQALVVVNSCLLPGNDRQLKLLYHVGLTIKLWVIVTGLAIAAPSLGDVLDLVGCAAGTMMAFIFPATCALKLEGHSDTALLILVVGGMVGVIGTFFSCKKIISDLAA